jgi:formylglycine-generating enzyme required for sulfatase activity
MNRRNLLLGTTGLALGISGCSNSSNRSSSVPAKKVTLDDCPALKAYIDSLCDIPGGTFKMGGEDYIMEGGLKSGRITFDDEKPAHKVRISAFRMGKTPVTVDMFEEYCNNTNLNMPPEPEPTWRGARKFNIGWVDKDHPIVNVNWNECKKFADWASEVSRVKLTLPSEAQFEYVCRGGKDGLEYPWGQQFDRKVVWCTFYKFERGSTGSVNRRVYVWKDHPWGLIDLVGNVQQWCRDWYDPQWYQLPQASERDVVNDDSAPSVEVKVDNTITKNGARCVRGTSWEDDAATLPEMFRCSSRSYDHAESRTVFRGFRLSAGPG